MIVLYFSCLLSSVPRNVSEPSDGHAAVPRRRLQRGSAGGEETLLFPGRQTLHVLLPDRLLSRQGTEHPRHCLVSDLSFLRARWCPVYIKNLRCIQHTSKSLLFLSLGRHSLLHCHGDGKVCADFRINCLYCHLQARDILMGKLSSWQDQCTDATEMPDSVLTMIEGLRTPIPITPLPSPSPSRHSVVRG